MFRLFLGVMTPFSSSNPRDEFYAGSRADLLDLLLLAFATVYGILLFLFCVPLFVLLPGPVSVILYIVGRFLLRLICLPLQGPSKVWSKTPTDPKVLAKYARVSGERWFFLNGCCVSGRNLQKNVDVLSETFGRPIFAIHNRTYGVLGDLFECIVQRSLGLVTEETRVCYEFVKAYCIDPNVKKVVMIAHSQGCIMASQILDQLYVDLPADSVAKLEVIESHMYNLPLRCLPWIRYTHSATPHHTSTTLSDVSMRKQQTT
jgi:hypothetical protein